MGLSRERAGARDSSSPTQNHVVDASSHWQLLTRKARTVCVCVCVCVCLAAPDHVVTSPCTAHTHSSSSRALNAQRIDTHYA